MPTIATLHARDLTVTRGPLLVLDAIDLLLSPGRRVGLVGPNGVGKSTLLQSLAGRIAPRSRNRAPHATVGDRRVPAPGARAARRRNRERRSSPGGPVSPPPTPSSRLPPTRSPPAPRAPTIATATRSTVGCRSAAPISTPASARCGTSSASVIVLLGQATATLSGGEAARCSLAALLLSRFDVYLLDEPTNDLDLDGLARLEAWVTGLDAAVALVSHDRAFLARTVTHVVELDEFTHRASEYAGGWAAYLEHARHGPPARVGALRRLRHEAQGARRPGAAGARVGDAGVEPGQEAPR